MVGSIPNYLLHSINQCPTQNKYLINICEMTNWVD